MSFGGRKFVGLHTVMASLFLGVGLCLLVLINKLAEATAVTGIFSTYATALGLAYGIFCGANWATANSVSKYGEPNDNGRVETTVNRESNSKSASGSK